MKTKTKTKTSLIRLIMIFILCSSGYSFSQKYDPRLEKNHGDEIATIYSSNHNYYNFLLFEMDYSYEIQNLSDIPSNIQVRNAADFKNAAGNPLTKKEVVKGSFNFKEWGIILNQNDPLVIKLDDQTALYFYDKVSNNKRFAKSPLYTK